MTHARLTPIALIIPLALMPIGAIAQPAPNPVVTQENKHFDHDELVLTRGQAIDFVNHDRVRHNIAIRAPDGSETTSTVQDPGQSNVVVFDQTGTYQVYCLIHPMMHLSVTAQPGKRQ